MGSSTDMGEAQTSTKSSAAKAASKMHRRSRSGCFTCRLRRKKCDEGRPKCKACKHLGLDCEYKRPLWWSNNDTRRKHKEDIKNIIKKTKTNEKSTSTFQSHYRRISPPVLSHSVPTSDSYSDAPGHGARHLTRASTPDSDDDGYDEQYDPAFATTPGFYDPYAMPLYAPHMSHPPMYEGVPYEIDVKTERQMFVNDVPTRRDSTISTFSTFVPPPPAAMLPSYTGDEFSHPDYFPHPVKHESMDGFGEESLDFNFFDFSHPPQTQPTSQPLQSQASLTLPIEDSDRSLFDYMLSNVLPLLFPILEANQHNSIRNDIILPALESNKAYLHSCLNAAAVHQKAHLSPTCAPSELTSLDDDILHHKFAFVTHVVSALNNDASHLSILEATLGMIALHTVVGHASTPTHPQTTSPEIPWHSHFQAATELVSKLSLPTILESMPHTGSHPPFNMTLTAWIDILGSTMLGRSPTFANTYRNKHLSGSTSGLAELMGCHDGVMYLLSEVACLDSLKVEHKLDDVAICSHITSLAQQLDATEPQGEVLCQPYSKSGALRPKQLSRNITAIFRKAARVYLCSLVPNFNRFDPAICNLVAQMTELLQFVPDGPEGFDRSLVWAYLVCGANCTPASSLRRVLASRIEELGSEADHGSFGRMVRLLHEVWRRNDEVAVSAGLCEATPVTAGSDGCEFGSVVQAVVSAGQQNKGYQCQNVHWRDVMQENGWDWLLI